MNGTDDPPRRDATECLSAAGRLEQPLGLLAEAMDGVERVAVQTPHSTYMTQVVTDRAKWHKLETITQPVATLAATLADRDAVQHLMQLLAPSLVFPAATPMQVDFSGEALRRARQTAELYKENLRKLISTELQRIDATRSS